jgi:hypothetical protein
MRGEVTSDLVQNAVRMVQDLAVGQTKDDETSCLQPSVAAAVAQRLGEVRSAIRFDDKAGFLAEEVDDERSDGMLSAKLGLHDLPAAQHGPKLLFRGRGSASQSTCLESPGAQQTRHAFLSAPRRNRLPPLFRLRLPSPFGLGIRHIFAWSEGREHCLWTCRHEDHSPSRRSLEERS